MTLMRRLLLLWALIFWQGGFMFYGAVVVPTGSRVLGSDLEQGMVTRSVTNALNVAGGVALAVWAWDIRAERGASRGGGLLRWLIWGLLVLTLGLLFWFHHHLDELLDPEGFLILDRPRFRSLHRLYLIVSTLHWGGSVVLSALTILAWRVGDVASLGRLSGTSHAEASETEGT